MIEISDTIEWKIYTINDVFDVIRGISFPKTAKTEQADSYIGCLRTANIQHNIEWDDLWHVPVKYMKDSEKVVRENDILISTANSLNLLGKSAYVNRVNELTTFGTFIVCLRSKCENPKYLFYYLQSRRFLDQVAHKASTTTNISNISTTVLKTLVVPVPPLDEQARIVARIEELFSELDNGVQTLQTIKQQLAVYRQAVLKEAFEGRLTKEWRLLNCKSDDWKEVKISEIVTNNKNSLKAGPFGSALKKEVYTQTGYKVYGQEQVIAGNENIGNYFVDETKYQELINCKICPGDILISLVGTVGKVLVLSGNCLPGIINPRLVKVTLDKEKMLPQFFKYYFESEYLRKLYKAKVHGATMDVLNLRMIKELPFRICPLEEQSQVLNEIESRLSVCDSIEKTVDTALAQAEAMRQSILKKAFEGGLV